jgi:hypothetical protein
LTLTGPSWYIGTLSCDKDQNFYMLLLTEIQEY